MKIIDVLQGTEEWRAARVGVPSASNFDLIVTTKGEPSKQRQKYLYKLAGEKLSGISEEAYQNEAMKRGTALEEEARKLYQIITDSVVEQVGFCVSEDGNYGCSPDGLVGKYGCIEIKCPTMATHIEYLLGGVIPTEYYQQVQGQLLVTGLEWCDFMSYYAGIKPLVVRMYPEKAFLDKLHAELKTFNKELNEIVEKLK